MSVQSVQAFNEKVIASPALQAKLRDIVSPMDFLAIAKAEGFDLNGQDLQGMVQQAFHQWIDLLPTKTGDFFRQVRRDRTLDAQLHTCRSSAEVIALALECNVDLSEADLHQAALAAEAVPGFSFEKLWFRGLGLIQ